MKLKDKFIIAMNKGIFNWLPDEIYLKLRYYIITGEKLNIDNPSNYNEKCQWLKLHDRKPEYSTMVDKYEVKEYVKKIIGNEYIIPTYGVYDNFDDIDFDALPNKFVMKCTHDSGGVVIVKNKKNIKIDEIRKKIKKSMKRNYYYSGREWQYKNVKPRIIIEKYMEDKETSSIMDYKFFCFNGIPKIMYISQNSHSIDQSIAFFDMDYNLTNCKRKDYKDLNIIPPKPKNFNQMKEFASILSKNISHLRVDFYEINGELYFGELTFFTGSGMIPFLDEKWNEILGNYINIK